MKNIGRASKEEFGEVGTVHEVKYGTLVCPCTEWNNNRMGIHSVEELNRVLGNSPTFNTVFELVEESDTVMEETSKELGQVVKAIKDGDTCG